MNTTVANGQTLAEILMAFPISEELKYKARTGRLTSHDLRILYRLIKKAQAHHPLYAQVMALLHEKSKELDGTLGLDDAFENTLENDMEPSFGPER